MQAGRYEGVGGEKNQKSEMLNLGYDALHGDAGRHVTEGSNSLESVFDH